MNRLMIRRQISTADFPIKNATGSNTKSKITSIRKASSDFHADKRPWSEYLDVLRIRRLIRFFIISIYFLIPRN
jgi:hypothetical protein